MATDNTVSQETTRIVKFELAANGRYVTVRDPQGKVVRESKCTDDSTAMCDWWLVILAYQTLGWRIMQVHPGMGHVTLVGRE